MTALEAIVRNARLSCHPVRGAGRLACSLRPCPGRRTMERFL